MKNNLVISIVSVSVKKIEKSKLKTIKKIKVISLINRIQQQLSYKNKFKILSLNNQNQNNAY